MSNSRYLVAGTFVIPALAFVALISFAVLFAPLGASADEGKKGGMKHDERFEQFLKKHEDGIRGHFMDRGKHRGWFKHNEEAREWMKDVHESIKTDDFSDFQDVVDDTPLEDETTNSIFNDLADASDAREDGDHEEARDIMKELREDGYHFKKLIHDSLKKLFGKN